MRLFSALCYFYLADATTRGKYLLPDAISTDEVYRAMDLLLQENSSIISKHEIGKSVSGKPIIAYRLFSESDPSLNAAGKCLLLSGLRGGEPDAIKTSVNFVVSLLADLAAGNTESMYLLKSRQLSFIPLVNPDAYSAGSAKNAAKTCPRDSAKSGVDLARNFDSHWQAQSSSDTCSDDFNGPSAFSEPETRAIRDFVKANNFVSAMNVEAGDEDVLTYPFNWNGDERMATPHEVFYDGLQAGMQFKISGPTSRTLKKVTFGEITDWLYTQSVLGASMGISIDQDEESLNKNVLRLRYWLYKSGPEILTLFVQRRMPVFENSIDEVGEFMTLGFRNSGLAPTSGSLKIVLDYPCNDECGPNSCEKINNFRVYDWSSKGVPSYHWSKSLEWPACDATFYAGEVRGHVCTVELGLNCKCWPIRPGYDVLPYGRISSYNEHPEMCQAAGTTGRVTREKPNQIKTSSYVLPVMIVGSLVGVGLWLNARFGVFRHGTAGYRNAFEGPPLE